MQTDHVTQSNAAKVASQNVATQATPSTKESTHTGDSTAIKTQSPPTTDTVKISSAGKKALGEATETVAQTAKEARSGDIQAKRLVERQAAIEESNESPQAKTLETR